MSGAFPHLDGPLWLALLAALPLLAWWHHRRGGLGALTYSRLPEGAGAGWRLHLPFYARLGAAGLLIVAAARPQLGYAREESLTEGIDIEIALDISGSMAAEDFQPKNRLTVAKQVVDEFIAGRAGDRIGVVVFSGGALTRAPLTVDHQMLGELVESVALRSLPDGTAIGVALANAAARLKDSTAKSKVVLLVTDGNNNAGEIDPLSAAAVAKGLGIKVYTIGVGRNGQVTVPWPVRNPLTGRVEMRRVLMNAEVDEGLLRKIAERTGGRFYRATDPQGLRRIFAEIDQLEKTPLKVKRYVRYREVFQPFVWAGLGLLLLPLATTSLAWTAEP